MADFDRVWFQVDRDEPCTTLVFERKLVKDVVLDTVEAGEHHLLMQCS